VSVSVVNGFKCYSSCDEAKARTGRDPHPKAQTASAEQALRAEGSTQKADRPGTGPAVTFGGALTGLNAVPPVQQGEIPTPANNQTIPVLDILA
jgi:hypothetical protein